MRKLFATIQTVMGITFHCEHCHKEVKAPDETTGKRGKCPYCKQSCYIPIQVSEDDIIPLAPIDETEERRMEQQRMELLKREREILAEIGGDPAVPLEHREDLTSTDLHHFVVNYCLDLSGGQKERAQTHVGDLKKYGGLGMEAVEDFLTGKVQEQALENIPSETLERFLRQLGDQL